MKLAAILALAALPLAAHADFSNILFKDTAGGQHIVAVEGLKITFANGLLKAESPDKALTLEVANLRSMEFSNETLSALSEADANADQSLTIYNAAGVSCGTYASLAKASEALAPGNYIIMFSNGLTGKIAISKK